MSHSQITLNQLPVGCKGKIVSLEYVGKPRRRLMDIGIVHGSTIEAVHKSPSGDPTAYFIKGTVIALRDEDAKKILLTRLA